MTETEKLDFSGLKLGFALCGSFCTFSRAFEALEALLKTGAEVFPIMSENAYSTDTRFGSAEEHRQKLSALCRRGIIHTIAEAEPIGPQKMLDALIIANCTGNTLAKLANSITDTAVVVQRKHLSSIYKLQYPKSN